MKRANIITTDNRVKYRRLILMLRPELKSMNCGMKRDERSNISLSSSSKYSTKEETWSPGPSRLYSCYHKQLQSTQP